jgi:hypothetical protein
MELPFILHIEPKQNLSGRVDTIKSRAGSLLASYQKFDLILCAAADMNP